MRDQESQSNPNPASARFFTPPDDLAACFTTFYKVDINVSEGQRLADYLLPEWSNLRFFDGVEPLLHSQDGRVLECRFQATGPSSHPTKFEVGATKMWGIGLLPLGWARFVGAQADEYADTAWDGEKCEAFRPFAPLYDILFGTDASDEETFAAITDFFRKLAPPPRDADRIVRIHEAMVDPHLIEVGALAERVGLTIRTLERVCQRHFGFPPRMLLRRQRLVRSLAAFMLSDGKSWTETIDRHYHDQAHFVHEFQAFMGMSPSKYIATGHPILSAFMANRQRVWGSPAQALDNPRKAEVSSEE